MFKKILLISVTLSLLAIYAWTHSGITDKLDKLGGHTDHKTGLYHFHNTKRTGPDPSKVLLSEMSEGSRLYIPSRLDWLAVEINSAYAVVLSRQFTKGTISGSVIPFPYKNTLRIAITYAGPLEKKANELVEFIKERVRRHAEYRGWASWIKIEVKIQKIQI